MRAILNKILTVALAIMVGLYFFGFMVAVPYFNWQYAQEHGFVRWLLLGEIAATARAFGWPYEVIMRFSQEVNPILIVPGKSIAGLELGMSREEVVSLLGEPFQEILPHKVEQLVQSGALIGEPLSGKAPPTTFLIFRTPNLGITLHTLQDQVRVYALQLAFTELINVQGYDFLQFKYLSDEEIARLGEPSYITRDKEMEKKMMAAATDGETLEYYMHDYRSLGLALSFVFDMDRKESNKNYIYLHAIAVL